MARVSVPKVARAASAIRLDYFARHVAQAQWLLILLALLYSELAGDAAIRSLPILTGIGAYFLFTLATVSFSRLLFRGHVAILLQTTAMVLFVGWLLFATGNLGGPLDNLFLLPIVVIALALGRWAALLLIGLVGLAYLAIMHAEGAQAMVAVPQLHSGMAHMLTFAIVGYLTAHLAEGVHEANERIQERRLEWEMSATLQRLKRAVEKSADAFIEVDNAGRIVEWNRRASELLGWRREEAIGQRVRELLVPERHRNVFDREFDNFLKTGESPLIRRRVETMALTRDGNSLPVEILVHDVRMPDQTYFDAFIQDISERRRLQSELIQQARMDPVTGCANRFGFGERLQGALRKATPQHPVLVIVLDLDGFKQVNDQYGHDTGDQLLAIMAQRIRHHVRGQDVVARLGGDEFAVLIEHVDLGDESGRRIADKLIAALAAPYHIDGATLQVTASIGLVVADRDMSADQLLRRADQAMYAAKRAGKNQYRVAE